MEWRGARYKRRKRKPRDGRSGVRWQRKFFCGWLTTRINQLQKLPRYSERRGEETENLKERRWGLSWNSIIQLCSDIYIRSQSFEDFCYRRTLWIDARQNAPILIKKQSSAPFSSRFNAFWSNASQWTLTTSKWGQREKPFLSLCKCIKRDSSSGCEFPFKWKYEWLWINIEFRLKGLPIKI